MVERARNHTKLVGQLDSLTDLEKVRAAKNVAAMTETPGWRTVVQLLEDRRAQLLDSLVGHDPVKSQAEYAAATAEVRGIGCALDAAQTVLYVGERSAEKLSESEGS